MSVDFATLTRELKEKYGTTPSTAGSGNNPSETPESTIPPVILSEVEESVSPAQPDDFAALTAKMHKQFGTTPLKPVAAPTPTRWESPKTKGEKAEKAAHFTAGLMTLEQAKSRGITEKEWLAMTNQAVANPELKAEEKEGVTSWRDLQSAPVTDHAAAFQNYISRYNAFAEAARTDAPNIGYGNAAAMVESRAQPAQELRREADRLTAWLETNRDRLPKETYEALLQTLTETRSGVDDIMGGFGDTAKGYAQFETEEDYNAYVQSTLDLEAAAAEIADLEAKREAYAQTDFDWTDAHARQQWHSGLDALDTEIAKKKLYLESAKALQAEQAALANILNGYDPTAHAATGQAGWEDYLATQEQIQQQRKKAEEEKSWLEKLVGYLGTTPDTSLPIANTQALAEGAKAQEEALTRPREDWTAEEQRTFGYLWQTDRQKAWQYARMVNIAKNEQAEAAARQRIQSAATDNPFAGAAHTAGAILSSPAALADLLNNITHYSATGSLPQSDGVLSPWEYSEAVTSGIGSHLNEIGGTVAEDVPIIGGKGWGDVYGLVTSIAKSFLAAHTGGGTMAFITNLGPSAMSGIESAKSAGATDEKAIAYGLLTGLAEAAAEKVGVDRLVGLKGKSILQNLLKQGVSEGLEEGLTSVANNFLDNLILQDKSQWQAAVNLYIRQGMTEAEAKKKAWTDMAEGIAYDTLGGFVSGMVRGGLETVADPKTHLTKKGLETSGDFLSKLTDPSVIAGEAETTTAPLTAAETSDLLDEAIARSTGAPEDPVAAALETLKSGGTVSNKQINHILQNAKAVSQLVEATGMKLPETASGKRAAVRTALQTLQESIAPTAPVGSGYIRSETSDDVILSERSESKNPSLPIPPPVANALETLRTGGTPTIAQTMAITADEAAMSYLQQAIGADYPINPITIKAALSNLAKMTATTDSATDSDVTSVESTTAPVGSGYIRSEAPVIKSEPTENAPSTESVGAAPDGFDPYSHLQYAHGNQPDRPDDARDVNVPKKDTYHRRVSEFIANAYGAEVVPDSFIPVLEDMTVAGAFGVDSQSWQSALNDANNRIKTQGAYRASQSITKAVTSGKIKDGDIATAMVLFAQYANRTDARSQDAATDLFADLSMMATMSGRNLQLFRLLRRLTPDGRLMAVKRSAEKVIDRIRTARGEDVDGSKTTVEVPPELADDYKAATDARAAAEDALRAAEEALAEAERAARAAEDARNIRDDALAEAEAAHAAADAAIADRDAAIAEMEAAERAAEEARRRAEEARDREREAEHEIYRYAASRLDATFMEKWDAWRYMAMLGNAKTQIRNIAGNLLFRPLAEVKRYIGSVLELTLPKEQRTKTILGAGKEGRELRKWAKADADTADIRELLEYSATTGDAAARHAIDDYRTIYETEWLEKARKGLRKVMEKEDMFFKKSAYVTSLASFIKARGYTSPDLTSGAVPTDVLNEGRAYAVKEALEATFNDQNAFSDFMCSLRYRGTNKVGRILSNVIGEGVLPFRRTPANIVVRAYEYSPATIPQLIYNGAYSVSHGKITASEFIDRISATLTGTAAIAMGAALASGILGCRLVGTEDDEEEKRQGHQSYALEVGGKSIPLSWAAPAMIPLFVGANLYNLWNPDEREERVSVTAFTDFLGAVGNSFEPLLEMSCLSSLSDFLKSSAYAEDNAVLVTYLASAATSYMTQFFPTILGQVESALEPKKTETFANASDPFLRTVQRTLGNLSQRLPFDELASTGFFANSSDPVLQVAKKAVKTASQITTIGDLYQTEKIDQWGRPAEEEQDPWYERAWDSLVNPHNTKTLQDTEVDKEIQRLKGVQPENLSPTTPEKTISYTTTGGEQVENHRLTAEEFAALEKAQGQTHFRLAQELIASEDYQALTDDQKAAVLLDIRSYAREYARGQVFSDYSYSAKWMGEVENGGAKAILNRQVSASLSDGITALTDAWKYGKGEETAQAAMDTAYETLSALTEDTRLELLSGLSKKVTAFVQAKDAGLETATFATLYRQYHNLDGTTTLTASQKAQKWAYALDSAQEQGTISSRQNTILRDNLTFFQGFTADSDGYDKLVTATGSASTADYVFDLVKGLTPSGGKSSVTDRQKREAIVDSDTLSQADIEAVLPLYMTDTLATRYETALDKGFTAEEFVEGYGVYQDRSGKNAREETIRTLVRDFGLGLARAKQLYEIFSNSP